MALATVPAAPPTAKNQRATSCPAPISASVPYQLVSRLSCRAFWPADDTASDTSAFLHRIAREADEGARDGFHSQHLSHVEGRAGKTLNGRSDIGPSSDAGPE